MLIFWIPNKKNTKNKVTGHLKINKPQWGRPFIDCRIMLEDF